MFLVGLVGLVAVACEDDEPVDDMLADAETSVGVDREALLGDVEQVRGLFDDASTLDAELIQDVSYNEGQLDVTVGEDVDGAEQAEAVCRDLSEALDVPDLQITVYGADDAEMASCQLGA